MNQCSRLQTGGDEPRPYVSVSACGAVRLAREIKRRIRDEVGEWITCSVGIAPNKRLAKLASEFNKPDGLVFINGDTNGLPDGSALASFRPERTRASEVEKSPDDQRSLDCASAPLEMTNLKIISRSELLASLKLRDLCGIGERIEARLHGMGITTVGGLAAAPLDLLVKEFGKYGYELHDMAMGHDASSVDAGDAEPKSMGHSVTLPRDLRTLEEIRPVVEELSEKVAVRLRRHGYRGSTIHIVLRFRDFTSRSEQTTIPDATDDGLRISREVMCILQRALPLLKRGSWRGCALARPVRLVGVSIGKLVRANPEQSSLFTKDRRWRAATGALDAANDRYGEWTVQRASLLVSERVLRKVAAAFRATSHLKSTPPPAPHAPPLPTRGPGQVAPPLQEGERRWK